MIPGMTPDKIKFPVAYDLKVIMDVVNTDKNNILFIESVLSKHNIPFKNFSIKPSSGGKYKSYSTPIVISDHITMRLLYSSLKENPAVKFAV